MSVTVINPATEETIATLDEAGVDETDAAVAAAKAAFPAWRDVPRAARRRRPDRPLELPAQHLVVEARARARVRQHRRAQAGGADTAQRAAASRARARGRNPRRRDQRARGQGPRRRAAAGRAP